MTAVHATARHMPSGMILARCGEYHGDAARFTVESDDVTCKRCLRCIDDTPFVPAPMVVVPLGSTRGSRFDDRYAELVTADRPGRVERRHLWPSVDRALRDYWTTRVDGYASKSAAGVTERIGRQGVRIQGGERRSPRAVMQAEKVAEVDTSLSWAVANSSSMLTPNQQKLVLMLRRVGEPIKGRRTRRGFAVDKWSLVSAERLATRCSCDEIEIGMTVRSLMSRLRVDMGARGLTPMPHGSREVLEAEARRAELEGSSREAV